MDNQLIARQATYLVKGVHPVEEVVLVETETTDGLVHFKFQKRFSLDGIVLVQAFGVTFTALGRFVNVKTESQAEIKEIPASILSQVADLVSGAGRLKPITPEEKREFRRVPDPDGDGLFRVIEVTRTAGG